MKLPRHYVVERQQHQLPAKPLVGSLNMLRYEHTFPIYHGLTSLIRMKRIVALMGSPKMLLPTIILASQQVTALTLNNEMNQDSVNNLLRDSLTDLHTANIHRM